MWAMEIMVNVLLIDKISALFSRSASPIRKREETTETSIGAGIISYYYQKVKLERTGLAKYGDYEIMDDKYPEISTALGLYTDNAIEEKGEGGEWSSPSRVK